jgi:hypothetical protein
MQVSSLPTPQPFLQFIDKPKRPLSAYNLFFQAERKNLLAERSVLAQGTPTYSPSKLGFANMAKTIASKWNTIDLASKKHFAGLAKHEKLRHKKATSEWKKMMKQQKFSKMTMPQIQQESTTEPTRFSNVSTISEDDAGSLSLESSGFLKNYISGIGSSFEDTDVCDSISMGEPSLTSKQQAHLAVLQDSWGSPMISSVISIKLQQQDLPSMNRMPNALSPVSAGMLNQGIHDLAQNLGEDCVDWLVDLFHPS